MKNSDIQLQALRLAIDDESFLKENLTLDPSDCFNESKEIVWTEIIAHYQKYKTLPTLAILRDRMDSAGELKTFGLKVIDEMSNVSVNGEADYIKESFARSRDEIVLKKAISDAADFVNEPDRAREILTNVLHKHRSKSTTPLMRSLYDFNLPMPGDPNELVLDRVINRQGKVMIVGPTGAGKSVLELQLAAHWAVGKPCLGLKPTRPLKSLIVQAEDDDGFIGELNRSFIERLSILPDSDDEYYYKKNVRLVQFSATGKEFISILTPYLDEFAPDILWINPLYSYCVSDQQKDVSEFLRQRINPLLALYNCACIVLHHPPKPSKYQTSNWRGSDFAYSGAGSMETANWARVTFTMIPTTNYDTYILRGNKLDKRLGWLDMNGNNTGDKYIVKSSDVKRPYWTEATPDEIINANKSVNNDIKLKRLLNCIPVSPDKISRKELLNKTGYKQIKSITAELFELVDSGKVNASANPAGTIFYTKLSSQ